MSQLAGVIVCISGDPRFDEDDNQHIRDQFTDENVSKWLKCRGSQLVEEVTKATTHLICSRAAYQKKGNHKVKAARKYGCKIVTYEWLTDTFQLLDYQNNKRAPPRLYHPGKPRDGEAISKAFKKREKKADLKAVKKEMTPAADGEDDARAAEEAAEAGMKHLALSKEKDPQLVSDTGVEKGTKVIDDIKEAIMPVNKKSGKEIGKQGTSAKVKVREPPADLNLYSICKDGSDLHQVEVWKPDGHGNARGCRLVLELYESKSAPKTYLFGTRKYSTPGSSTYIRGFPSEAPRDKEHEFGVFRSFFRHHTGVHWCKRDSMPSNGPFYYLSPAAAGETFGNAGHKNKFDELRERGERNPKCSVAVPHEHCDDADEASSKRKRSFTEERPAKAFKVSKPSVADDSARVTNCGSETA